MGINDKKVLTIFGSPSYCIAYKLNSTFQYYIVCSESPIARVQCSKLVPNYALLNLSTRFILEYYIDVLL